MGRLKGYLKNTKQPAPWENKVQAAFKIYIQKKYGHTTLFHLKKCIKIIKFPYKKLIKLV